MDVLGSTGILTPDIRLVTPFKATRVARLASVCCSVQIRSTTQGKNIAV